MDAIKNAPAPLRRKLILTALLGLLCLLIGAAMFLFIKDRIMLLLSAAVFLSSLFRAWSLYGILRKGEYEVVEGTCVGVTPKPLRKYRKVRIMDDAGNELTLLLGKQTRVKIGFRYRFFFKKAQRFSVGSESIDAALSSDCFLGFEELGEFSVTS